MVDEEAMETLKEVTVDMIREHPLLSAVVGFSAVLAWGLVRLAGMLQSVQG